MALWQEREVREPKSPGTAGCTSTCWQNWGCGDCQSSSACRPEASRADRNCNQVCCQSRCSKGRDVATGGRGRWRRVWQEFSLLLVLLRTKSFHSPVVLSSVRLGFLIKKPSPVQSVFLGNAGSTVRSSLSWQLHTIPTWWIPSEGLILQLWRSL